MSENSGVGLHRFHCNMLVPLNFWYSQTYWIEDGDRICKLKKKRNKTMAIFAYFFLTISILFIKITENLTIDIKHLIILKISIACPFLVKVAILNREYEYQRQFWKRSQIKFGLILSRSSLHQRRRLGCERFTDRWKPHWQQKVATNFKPDVLKRNWKKYIIIMKLYSTPPPTPLL